MVRSVGWASHTNDTPALAYCVSLNTRSRPTSPGVTISHTQSGTTSMVPFGNVRHPRAAPRRHIGPDHAGWIGLDVRLDEEPPPATLAARGIDAPDDGSLRVSVGTDARCFGGRPAGRIARERVGRGLFVHGGDPITAAPRYGTSSDRAKWFRPRGGAKLGA